MISKFKLLDVLYEILVGEFLLKEWLTGLLLVAMALFVFIFFRIKSKFYNNRFLIIKQRLQEQTELLAHSVSNGQQLLNRADMAIQNKTQLLTRINHEIRTPMNGVIGMAGLLSETSLTVEQREYARAIQNSGESLLVVINEILMNDIIEYSKVEISEELNPKDFELRSCIEEVLEVFAGKASNAGIELLYEIDPKVPAQIIADSARLRKILMNLIDNALKFTHNGEVIIAVHLLSASVEKSLNLEFEVRDTGKGISVKLAKDLSENFLLVNSVTSTKSGTELGLEISKRLVNLMGGQIEIGSVEGVGSTFKFTIQTSQSLQAIGNKLLHERDGLDSNKILIVDDNAASQKSLKHQMELLKLTPVIASSGIQALDILSRSNDIDLVITDLNMPEMNGIELAKNIHRKYPNSYIILMNAIGDERYKLSSELFISVLSKPLKQHLLNTQIFRVLRKKHVSIKNLSFNNKLTHEFSKRYPLSILIGEDDAINQQLAIKVLNKLGYNPDIAANGKEVLEIVGDQKYDLILMDVQMPIMDGLEATRMIRLCLVTQPIIVAMTANSMQGDREQCLQAGMDDYISKPINIHELVNTIEKWGLEINAQK